MKIPKFLKIISLVTCTIFTANTIALSAPDMVYRIRVPEKYGKVTERWKKTDVHEFKKNGLSRMSDKQSVSIRLRSFQDENSELNQCKAVDNDRTVIIVEDAHENFGAQKNIAEIIQALLPQIQKTEDRRQNSEIENQKTEGNHLTSDFRYQTSDFVIGVEGAAGEISINHLRKYPILSARKEASDELMKKGYLTGAENAAIIAGEPFTLYGIENTDLFTKDFKAFHKLSELKPQIEQFFKGVEETLSVIKESLFNDELKKFDTLYTWYIQEKIGLDEYYKHLSDYRKEKKYDLVAFPNIVLFQEILRFQSQINNKKLLQEAKSLAKELGEEYRGGEKPTSEYILSLWVKAQKVDNNNTVISNQLSGSSKKSAFSTIERFVKCERKYALLDVSLLNEKIENFSNKIKLSLCQKDDERTIIIAEESLQLLKRILTLKGKRRDVSVYNLLSTPGVRKAVSVESMLNNLKRLAEKNKLVFKLASDGLNLDELIETAMEFYEIAEAREESMVNNLMEKMEAEGKQYGVLIAGGYHTQGITQILRDKNISYITIRPEIKDIYDKAGFTDRMMGRLMPLAPHLTSYITTSYLSGLIEMLCGEVGKEKVLSLFDSDWTQHVGSDPTAASLLLLMKDHPEISRDIRSKALPIHRAAREITNRFIEEEITEEDSDSIITRVKEIAKQEDLIQRLIDDLGLEEKEESALFLNDREKNLFAITNLYQSQSFNDIKAKEIFCHNVTSRDLRKEEDEDIIPVKVKQTADMSCYFAFIDGLLIHEDAHDIDVLSAYYAFKTCSGIFFKGEKDGKIVLGYAQLHQFDGIPTKLEDDAPFFKTKTARILRAIENLNLKNISAFISVWTDAEYHKAQSIINTFSTELYPTLNAAKQRDPIPIFKRDSQFVEILIHKDGIVFIEKGHHDDEIEVIPWDEINKGQNPEEETSIPPHMLEFMPPQPALPIESSADTVQKRNKPLPTKSGSYAAKKDLNEIIQNVVRVEKRITVAQGITNIEFIEKYPHEKMYIENKDVVVEGDQYTNVENALGEVIENAIKYRKLSLNNEIRIDLSCIGTKAIVEIKDNGIGIPKDELKDIWKRGYRGRNAIKQTKKGRGCGLFIADIAIRGNKGEIFIESTEGEGTTVRIELPLLEDVGTTEEEVDFDENEYWNDRAIVGLHRFSQGVLWEHIDQFFEKEKDDSAVNFKSQYDALQEDIQLKKDNIEILVKRFYDFSLNLKLFINEEKESEYRELLSLLNSTEQFISGDQEMSKINFDTVLRKALGYTPIKTIRGDTLETIMGNDINLQIAFKELFSNAHTILLGQKLDGFITPNEYKNKLDKIVVEKSIENDMAVIRISDKGPGFSKDALKPGKYTFGGKRYPQMFDCGFTRDVEGGGMGLTDLLFTIMAHGGSIDAENLPEGGAIVTVRLPIAILSQEKKKTAPDFSSEGPIRTLSAASINDEGVKGTEQEEIEDAPFASTNNGIITEENAEMAIRSMRHENINYISVVYLIIDLINSLEAILDHNPHIQKDDRRILEDIRNVSRYNIVEQLAYIVEIYKLNSNNFKNAVKKLVAIKDQCVLLQDTMLSMKEKILTLIDAMDNDEEGKDDIKRTIFTHLPYAIDGLQDRIDLAYGLPGKQDDCHIMQFLRENKKYLMYVCNVEDDIVIHNINKLRLLEALRNLRKNAVLHGESGIALTIRREGDNGVFIISDTGKGIDPDLLVDNKLFELGVTSRKDREGKIDEESGLGLALVKRFVDDHGGTIEVDSLKKEDCKHITPGHLKELSIMNEAIKKDSVKASVAEEIYKKINEDLMTYQEQIKKTGIPYRKKITTPEFLILHPIIEKFISNLLNYREVLEHKTDLSEMDFIFEEIRGILTPLNEYGLMLRDLKDGAHFDLREIMREVNRLMPSHVNNLEFALECQRRAIEGKSITPGTTFILRLPIKESRPARQSEAVGGEKRVESREGEEISSKSFDSAEGLVQGEQPAVSGEVKTKLGDMIVSNSQIAYLYDEWNTLCEEVGADGDRDGIFMEIIKNYSEDGRYYHTLDHIEYMLRELENIKDKAKDLLALQFAIWFHDIIYDPKKQDNEEKSADVAVEACKKLKLDNVFGERVKDLILITKQHEVSDDDIDAMILMDLDLAILGGAQIASVRFVLGFSDYVVLEALRNVAQKYDRGIRNEFSFVEALDYTKGRLGVLKMFQQRKFIYHLDYFKEKYEDRAQKNLEYLIGLLENEKKVLEELIKPQGYPPFSTLEYLVKKTAVYPGYFNEFSDLELDIIKHAEGAYDAVVILVMPQYDEEEISAIQRRVDGIHAKIKDHEKVTILGIQKRDTVRTFVRAIGSQTIIRRLRKIPATQEQLAAESEKASETYHEYGLETVFVVPSIEFLQLPGDLKAIRVEQFNKTLNLPPDTTAESPIFYEAIDAFNKKRAAGKEKAAVNKKIAFYAGSFDPITNGHIEVIFRASQLFEKVYVCVGINPDKEYMFSLEEREEMVRDALRLFNINNVEVISHKGITVDAAIREGAGVLIRGARSIEDLEDELPLAWVNMLLEPRENTFLLVPYKYVNVSSSTVKEELEKGDPIHERVSSNVYWKFMKSQIKERKKDVQLIGLVGGLGSGKSTVLKRAVENEYVYGIDLDEVNRQLQEDATVIREIKDAFGIGVVNAEGGIDYGKLNDEILNDEKKMYWLKRIMYPLLCKETMRLVNEALNGEYRVIIIEGIRLLDMRMDQILDEVWFVDSPEDDRAERMVRKNKDMPAERARLIVTTQAEAVRFAKDKADVIIDNSKGLPELLSKVDELLSQKIPAKKPTWQCNTWEGQFGRKSEDTSRVIIENINKQLLIDIDGIEYKLVAHPDVYLYPRLLEFEMRLQRKYDNTISRNSVLSFSYDYERGKVIITDLNLSDVEFVYIINMQSAGIESLEKKKIGSQLLKILINTLPSLYTIEVDSIVEKNTTGYLFENYILDGRLIKRKNDRKIVIEGTAASPEEISLKDVIKETVWGKLLYTSGCTEIELLLKNDDRFKNLTSLEVLYKWLYYSKESGKPLPLELRAKTEKAKHSLSDEITRETDDDAIDTEWKPKGPLLKLFLLCGLFLTYFLSWFAAGIPATGEPVLKIALTSSVQYFSFFTSKLFLCAFFAGVILGFILRKNLKKKSDIKAQKEKIISNVNNRFELARHILKPINEYENTTIFIIMVGILFSLLGSPVYHFVCGPFVTFAFSLIIYDLFRIWKKWYKFIAAGIGLLSVYLIETLMTLYISPNLIFNDSFISNEIINMVGSLAFLGYITYREKQFRMHKIKDSPKDELLAKSTQYTSGIVVDAEWEEVKPQNPEKSVLKLILISVLSFEMTKHLLSWLTAVISATGPPIKDLAVQKIFSTPFISSEISLFVIIPAVILGFYIVSIFLSSGSINSGGVSSDFEYTYSLIEIKKAAIASALIKSKGNKNEAAKKLGIPVWTIRRMIRRYSIDTDWEILSVASQLRQYFYRYGVLCRWKDIERNFIVLALKESNGIKTKAARILGIAEDTLNKRIIKHSIDPHEYLSKERIQKATKGWMLQPPESLIKLINRLDKQGILAEILDKLSPQEKNIILKHCVERSCSLQDLGDKYVVTRERIRQIEEEVEEKIEALIWLKESRYSALYEGEKIDINAVRYKDLEILSKHLETLYPYYGDKFKKLLYWMLNYRKKTRKPIENILALKDQALRDKNNKGVGIKAWEKFTNLFFAAPVNKVVSDTTLLTGDHNLRPWTQFVIGTLFFFIPVVRTGFISVGYETFNANLEHIRETNKNKGAPTWKEILTALTSPIARGIKPDGSINWLISSPRFIYYTIQLSIKTHEKAHSTISFIGTFISEIKGLIAQAKAFSKQILLSQSPRSITEVEGIKLESLSEEEIFDLYKEVAYENISYVTDEKIEDVFNHSRRVRDIAVIIARKIGMDEHAIHTLNNICLVHDIGKLAEEELFDTINQEGELDPWEKKVVNHHAWYSIEVLQDKGIILTPRELITILYHHNLGGMIEITDFREYFTYYRFPQILVFADHFDAEYDYSRPYKNSFKPLLKTLEEIKAKFGNAIDEKTYMIVEELIKKRDKTFFNIIDEASNHILDEESDVNSRPLNSVGAASIDDENVKGTSSKFTDTDDTSGSYINSRRAQLHEMLHRFLYSDIDYKPRDLKGEELFDHIEVEYFVNYWAERIQRETNMYIYDVPEETLKVYLDNYLDWLLSIQRLAQRHIDENELDPFDIFLNLQETEEAKKVISQRLDFFITSYPDRNNWPVVTINDFNKSHSQLSDILEQNTDLEIAYKRTLARYYYELNKTGKRLKRELKNRIKTESNVIKSIIVSFHNSNVDMNNESLDWLLDIHENHVYENIEWEELYKKYGDRTKENYVHHGTNYNILRIIANEINLGPDDVFYDLGSGFGRFLFYLALINKKGKLKGIELVPEEVNEANRIKDALRLENVEFIQGNVRDEDFSDGTVFFLYHPFEEKTLDIVIQKLKNISIKKKIKIISWGNCSNEFSKQSDWLKPARYIQSTKSHIRDIAIFESKEEKLEQNTDIFETVDELQVKDGSDYLSDSQQIGKEAEVRDWSLEFQKKDQKASVGVYQPKSRRKLGDLQLSRNRKINPIKEVQKEISKVKFKNDEHRNLIHEIIRLFEHSPPKVKPYLYTFKTIIKDLIGFAFPQIRFTYLEKKYKSLPRGFISLHEDLRNNPIALFHELSHYFIDIRSKRKGKGLLELSCINRKGSLYILVKGRETFHQQFRELGKVKLSKETLAMAAKWGKKGSSPHYILRALQREIFGKDDINLSEDIKKKKQLSGSSLKDDYFQESKTIFEEITKSEKKFKEKLAPKLKEKTIEEIGLEHVVELCESSKIKIRSPKVVLQELKSQIELLKRMRIESKQEEREMIEAQITRGEEALILGVDDEEIRNKLDLGYVITVEVNGERYNYCDIKRYDNGIFVLDTFVEKSKTFQEIPIDLSDAKVWLELGLQAEMTQIDLQIEALEEIVAKLENGETTTGIDTLDYMLGLAVPEVSPTNIDDGNPLTFIERVKFGLVHGPASTGKTTLLVQAIKNITMKQNMPVVVLAPQHPIVDEITIRADKEKIPLLRCGTQFHKMRTRVKLTNCAHCGIGNKIFKKRYSEYAGRGFLLSGTVIGGALEPLMNMLSNPEKYPLSNKQKRNFVMIVEEAALINYPELLTAVYRLKPKRLILVGDHKQFSPYKLSAKYKERKQYRRIIKGFKRSILRRYETSSFKDLIKRPFSRMRILINYRNHWLIVRLAQFFYRGFRLHSMSEKLGDTAERDTLEIVDTSQWSRQSYQNFDFDAESYFNKTEARLIIVKIKEFFKKISKDGSQYTAKDIMIITPYNGQIRYIKKLIDEIDDKEISFDDKKVLKENVITSLASQSRENRVVLVSLVRSSDKKKKKVVHYKNNITSPFMDDEPIVNDPSLLLVTITRAKEKLFIVGNRETLEDLTKESKSFIARNMYSWLFAFLSKKKSYMVSEITKLIKDADTEDDAEVALTGNGLEKLYVGNVHDHVKTIKSKLNLPHPLDVKDNVIIIGEGTNTVFLSKRIHHNKIVWAFKFKDRRKIALLLSIVLREDAQARKKKNSKLVKMFFDVGKKYPKEDMYGLRPGGGMKREDKQLFESLKKYFIKHFDDNTAHRLAFTLARMKPGSLEILYVVGLINKKDLDVLINKEHEKINKISNSCISKFEKLVESYKNSSLNKKHKEQMMWRLIPLRVIDFIAAECDTTPKNITTIIIEHPDSPLWLLKAAEIVDKIKDKVGGLSVAWRIVMRQKLKNVDKYVRQFVKKVNETKDIFGGEHKARKRIVNVGLDKIDELVKEIELKKKSAADAKAVDISKKNKWKSEQGSGRITPQVAIVCAGLVGLITYLLVKNLDMNVYHALFISSASLIGGILCIVTTKVMINYIQGLKAEKVSVAASSSTKTADGWHCEIFVQYQHLCPGLIADILGTMKKTANVVFIERIIKEDTRIYNVGINVKKKAQIEKILKRIRKINDFSDKEFEEMKERQTWILEFDIEDIPGQLYRVARTLGNEKIRISSFLTASVPPKKGKKIHEIFEIEIASRIPLSSEEIYKKVSTALRSNVILDFGEQENDLLVEGNLIDRVMEELLYELSELGIVLTENERELLAKALNIIGEKDISRARKDGKSPFISHHVAIVKILAQECGVRDASLFLIALLHDSIEDGQVSYEELIDMFGIDTADVVDLLTRVGYKFKPGVEKDYLSRILGCLYNKDSAGKIKNSIVEKGTKAILVKLADRTHNLRTLDGLKENARRNQYFSTLDIFIPEFVNKIDIKKLDKKFKKEIEEAIETLHKQILKAGRDFGFLNDKNVINLEEVQLYTMSIDGTLRGLQGIDRYQKVIDEIAVKFTDITNVRQWYSDMFSKTSDDMGQCKDDYLQKIYKFLLKAHNPKEWSIPSEWSPSIEFHESQYMLTLSNMSAKELIREYDILSDIKGKIYLPQYGLWDIDDIVGKITAQINAFENLRAQTEIFKKLYGDEGSTAALNFKFKLVAEKKRFLLLREWVYRHWNKELKLKSHLLFDLSEEDGVQKSEVRGQKKDRTDLLDYNNDIERAVRQLIQDIGSDYTIDFGDVYGFMNKESWKFKKNITFEEQKDRFFEKLFTYIERNLSLQAMMDESLNNAYDAIGSVYDKRLLPKGPPEGYRGTIKVSFAFDTINQEKRLIITIADNGLGIYAADNIQKKESPHVYIGRSNKGKLAMDLNKSVIGADWTLTRETPRDIFYGDKKTKMVISIPLKNLRARLTQSRDEEGKLYIQGLPVIFHRNVLKEMRERYKKILEYVLDDLMNDYYGFFSEFKYRDGKIVITKEGEKIDRKFDALISVPENILKECLENKEKINELKEYILPFALSREKISMYTTIDEAVEELKKQFILKWPGNDTPFDFNNNVMVHLYLEELYWTWMYKMTSSDNSEGKSAEEHAKELLFEAMQQIHEFVTYEDVKRISSYFLKVKEKNPDLLWNIFLQPLAYIKNFIERQHFNSQLCNETYSAIDRTIEEITGSKNGIEEFNRVERDIRRILETHIDASPFIICIDKVLRESRGYELIKNVLGKEEAKRNITFTIVDETNIDNANLLLAFEDSEITQKHSNVYAFSKDFKTFTGDLFLLSIFFDCLLARGLKGRGFQVSSFDWVGEIGTVHFHKEFLTSFNKTLLEYIQDRLIIQVAA